MTRTLSVPVLPIVLLVLLAPQVQAQGEPPVLPPPSPLAPFDPAIPYLAPPGPEDAVPAPAAPAVPPAAPASPPPAALFALNPALGLTPGLPGAVPFPTAGYRVAPFPLVPVRGQNTDLSYVEQDLHGSLPLWSDGPSRWSLVANLRNELFHTGGTVLPDSQRPFPDTLSTSPINMQNAKFFKKTSAPI